MASTYLSRTPSSATNRKTFTISCWFKRNNLANVGAFQTITAAIYDTGNYYGDFIRLTDDDTLDVIYYDGVVSYRLRTNRKFRDTSAWYHLVVAFDTTQATASNRLKIYINGVQETSFQTETYPSLDRQTEFNNTVVHWVGFRNNEYWQGLMSHFHLIDGTAYDASAFGEFDANGVWKIKTSPSVTYGTNGFFILKDGNSVTDQSGNGNNFTVAGGTLTNTEDSPSNVFATLNPLYTATDTNFNYSNGNTVGSNSGLGRNNYLSTLGVSSGKYYIEAKANVSGSNYATIGVSAVDSTLPDDKDNYIGKLSDGVGYFQSGIIRVNAITVETVSSYTTNDIIGVAGDFDNNKVYFYKNGVLQTTTGITIPSDKTYYFGGRIYDNNTSWTFNFGNGYFGTTAVSSAGTNASGNGIFEYDVPTGYTALSTKGLNL